MRIIAGRKEAWARPQCEADFNRKVVNGSTKLCTQLCCRKDLTYNSLAASNPSNQTKRATPEETQWLPNYNARIQLNGSRSSSDQTHQNCWTTPRRRSRKSN